MREYMTQSDTLNTTQKIVSRSVAKVLKKQIGHYLDRNYGEDFFYKQIHNGNLEEALNECLKSIQKMKAYEERSDKKKEEAA